MRFGISIPQLDADTFDGPGFRTHLARAEELGFESGWVLEQLVGPTPLIPPLELLAYAAACTERLRLGVAVLVASLHDPLHLAAAVTAVDRLSHGRVDVGVSAGGRFRRFEAFGVEPDSFVTRFSENLRLMKAAWSDDPEVTFHGRFRRLDGLAITPKPVQRPHPPIWFGANAPRSLARAVRLGDGFLGAGSSTTAAFREHVGIVRRELDRQGRDPGGFRIGKRLYVGIDDDAVAARRRVDAGLRRIYGDRPGIGEVPACGTADAVVRGVADVLDAGAELVVLNTLGATVAEDREQMERLAADVIPRLT